MAAIYLIGFSICSFCAVFIALPSQGGELLLVGASARSYVRYIIKRLANTAFIALVLKNGPVARFVRHETKLLKARSVVVNRYEMCAILCVALVLAMLGAMIVAQSLLGALVIAGAGVIALMFWDSSEQKRKKHFLAQEMPAVFRMMATTIGSGATLSQAISYVSTHSKEEIAEAFSEAALRLQCGDSPAPVLDKLSQTLDAPGAGLLASALLISHRSGSPLKDLFMRSAKLVENEGENERLLAVKTAQVRLSVRVVCVLPLVMVGLLALISPDFRLGLASTTGVACISLAALLDLVAVAITRRLVRGVLQ